MNKKIIYKVQKSKYPEDDKKYIVIYESETERGYGCGRLFKGTLTECKKIKKEIEGRL